MAKPRHCDAHGYLGREALKSARWAFQPNVKGHDRRTCVKPWNPNGKPSCHRKLTASAQVAHVGMRLEPFSYRLRRSRNTRSKPISKNGSIASIMRLYWSKRR